MKSFQMQICLSSKLYVHTQKFLHGCIFLFLHYFLSMREKKQIDFFLCLGYHTDLDKSLVVPCGGTNVTNNLSYNHSILFKMVSVESLNTVDYTRMIYFGFIVIQTFLESNNARDARFCQDKSLVIYRINSTKDKQTLV